jgi:hypothetical protein
MALERDNTAERLVRIDKLIAENTPTGHAEICSPGVRVRKSGSCRRGTTRQ